MSTFLVLSIVFKYFQLFEIILHEIHEKLEYERKMVKQSRKIRDLFNNVATKTAFAN